MFMSFVVGLVYLMIDWIQQNTFTTQNEIKKQVFELQLQNNNSFATRIFWLSGLEKQKEVSCLQYWEI